MLKLKQVPELGPLEFRLLRILWKRKAATAGEVLDQYNAASEKELKYTTVMTLLTRMVEKRVLEVDRSRQPFQFSARIGRDQLLTHRLKEFVDLFFEGRPVDLAARLVEDGPLPEEAIERLEKLLRQQRDLSTSSEESE